MKKITAILMLAAVLVAGATLIQTPSHADPPSRPRAAAILYMTDGEDGNFIVWEASVSGIGVPRIQRLEDGADAIKKLLEAGLTPLPQSNPLHYTFVR